LLETPKAIIYHSGMREHKCEGLKKIWMNMISILKILKNIKNIKIFNMKFINEMDNQQPTLLAITIRFND
jgi:hypothetical protein